MTPGLHRKGGRAEGLGDWGMARQRQRDRPAKWSRLTTPNPSALPPFLCNPNEGMPQVRLPASGRLSREHIWSPKTGNWLGRLQGSNCLDHGGRVVAWSPGTLGQGMAASARPARAASAAAGPASGASAPWACSESGPRRCPVCADESNDLHGSRPCWRCSRPRFSAAAAGC
jgi:hypothetical protein